MTLISLLMSPSPSLALLASLSASLSCCSFSLLTSLIGFQVTMVDDADADLLLCHELSPFLGIYIWSFKSLEGLRLNPDES